MSPEFLTQEGFEKLEAELTYLRNEKRKEVAARLHEAAESSLCSGCKCTKIPGDCGARTGGGLQNIGLCP